MSHYEIEIAKQEARTPLFYYPYSVKIKSELAKKTLALYFRNITKFEGLTPLTEKNFARVNDENLKQFSGKHEFHYNNPNETEGTRLSMVNQGALRSLAGKGIYGFAGYKENTKSYDTQLSEGRDFEIIIGERVEVEQPPKKITFDDLPDLMGINEEETIKQILSGGYK